jgi:hypothetical protein
MKSPPAAAKTEFGLIDPLGKQKGLIADSGTQFAAIKGLMVIMPYQCFPARRNQHGNSNWRSICQSAQ